MNKAIVALAPFASLVSLALGVLPAHAAPARSAARPAAARPAAARPAAVAAPSTAILPVPLMPVVPAGQRQCSAKTASGLGTLTLKAAEGARPAKGDYVLVNYIGYLAADGRVFDQNTSAAFPVEGVIPGFSEGLQLMTKGSTWRFCVPSALGYGAQGAGENIPANADLVFQVELVDYKTAEEVEKMRAAAAAAQAAPADPAAAAAPAPAPKP